MLIRLSGIVSESCVDGPGLRYVVFTQGCKHNCTGCHNPETHDFSGGYLKDVDEIIEEIKKDKVLRGVTISGGDPIEQPEAVAYLCKEVVKLGKTVWVYTGYTYEQLVMKNNEHINEILQTIEVLVDGLFIKSLKREGLRYRGSSNQRVIDCKLTLECGEVRIY